MALILFLNSCFSVQQNEWVVPFFRPFLSFGSMICMIRVEMSFLSLSLSRKGEKMAIAAKSNMEIKRVLDELAMSARYMVNMKGDKTDVVLSRAAWENLMALLEEMDDRNIVRQWLPKLKQGPESSGALRWDHISDKWEDE